MKQKNSNNSFKQILNNQSGVALLMVITVVALLTFLLADFTFEVKLNKVKAYNMQDKVQAQLNAEAGLKFAIAKMKLYKEARNLLEQNESLKDVISPDILESVVTQPFMYPITLPKDANVIQKSAVEEFSKNSLIKGMLMVETSPVNSLLNPNNLRMIKDKTEEEEVYYEEDQDKDSPQAYIEKELVDMLKNAIEDEKEKDEVFEYIIGNTEPETLVQELKFFVNDKGNFYGAEKANFESKYLDEEIIPKHGPLSSMSELHLLAGWNDAIIDLVKDNMTVHEVAIIPINEINASQLKVIFPMITDDQIKDFFEYRDGKEDESGKTAQEGSDSGPHPFKTEQDFQNLIVERLYVLPKDRYDARLESFAKAGLKIGIANKLFKITSRGEFNKASYTIEAYVDLPIKPVPTPEPAKTPTAEDDEKKEEEEDEDKDKDEDKEEETKKESDSEDKDKEPPVELLEPRVIELIIK